MRRSLFAGNGLIIVTALAGTPALAADVQVPPPPARNQTAGLALQIETGRYDAGHGVALAYYQPLPIARLTVGAEVGAGSTGNDTPGAAARLHLFVAYGQMHRLLAAAGWSVIDRDTLRLHGAPAVDRSHWGPEATFGYELVGIAGPVVRGWLGLGHVRRPPNTGIDRWRWGLGFALGWKLW